MVNIARFSRAFRLQAVSKLPQTVHTLGTNLVLIPIGIASSVLIARTIGPAGKGAFDLIIATATLLLMVLGLSLPAGVTYEVARGDANIPSLARRLVLLAFALAVVQFGQADRFLPPAARNWWVLAISVYLLLEMLACHWRAILVGRQEITKSNHCELIARIA